MTDDLEARRSAKSKMVSGTRYIIKLTGLDPEYETMYFEDFEAFVEYIKNYDGINHPHAFNVEGKRVSQEEFNAIDDECVDC